jgi:type II secretory pathway pseudopilin PulG
MIICTRRFITVIELLMVVAIIAMIAGLVGFNIRRLFVEQRFNTEVSLVVDQLRLAQDLMLIMQNEAHVKFETLRDNKGIRYWIELEKKPSNAWMREITRPKQPLTTIRRIDFQELVPSLAAHSMPGVLDIQFLSGGSVMSSGVITLSTSDSRQASEGSQERYICLPGYPNPISSTSKEAEACSPRKEVDIAERLTFAIQREISEKKPKNNTSNATKTNP